MTALVNFGSSDAEVFDYIFGKNPSYHSNWLSGWSASHLNKEGMDGFLANISDQYDRNSLIFLSFGFNDFNFDLKRQIAKGEYNIGQIRNRATSGIKNAYAILKQMNFSNVYATFHALPTSVSAEYWQKWSLPDVNPSESALHFYKMSRDIAAAIPTISIFDETLSKDYFPVLDPIFHRQKDDVQPDFIKTQKLLWKKIKLIPGMIEKRAAFLTETYPHIGRGYSRAREDFEQRKLEA